MKSKSVLFGCLVGAAFVAGGCATNRIEVQQFGRMHEVLGGGAEYASSRVALNEVLSKPHAVGVGALAGLRGEITIRDGQAWVARPTGETVTVAGPSPTSTEHAALLTVSYIEAWQEMRIDQDLAGEALERFIDAHAGDAKIDQSRPFPFVIEGELTDLRMHVINGECPMRPGAKLTPAQQPWRYSSDRGTPATVVGFYAADSVGNLTHPGTSIHAHALLDVDGREVTGHVERLAVAAGGVLKLPATK